MDQEEHEALVEKALQFPDPFSSTQRRQSGDSWC
jgi:hypothetical protein